MHTDISNETDLDLIVADRTEAADGVVLLTLCDPRGVALPPWQPGAHIDLVMGSDLTRQYSLCGDPADTHRYQIGVLREVKSRGGSSYVHDYLAVGSEVHARGPRNNFSLLPAPAYVFIAGGIGITPIIPMMAAADAADAEWRLFYGGRTRASMAFAEDLLSKHPCRVTIHPQDEFGLLDLAAILDALPKNCGVYCCGPEALLSAVEHRCASRWPNVLHVERFAPRPLESAPVERAFEVELSESGRTIFVPIGKSILDALNDVDIEVLSACGEGTCGTCETPVLEGIVDHRDSILTPEERAVNTSMMICVSRAACSRLVLKL